jgi:hypothetical protein
VCGIGACGAGRSADPEATIPVVLAGTLVYEGVELGRQIYQAGRTQSNEWTDRAVQAAPQDPCGWLAAQKQLPQNLNPATQAKIVQAQKFLGCRNIKKRKRRP